MGDGMFQEATPAEIAQMLLLILGMGFALMVPFVWVFGRTVALKKRPDERALWTSALAYGSVSILFIFLGGEFFSAWLAPLVPLPGAVIIYFWLRNTYRKGWVDDDRITEGLSLENDDWRIGIVVILTLIAAAAFKVLVLR